MRSVRLAFLKFHLLRHRLTVFVPKVAIHLHRQRSPVLVIKPTRDGRDVHAGFNAPGREKMAKIVMCDPSNSKNFAANVHGPTSFLAILSECSFRKWL